jgi:hypothetical protein
LLGSRGVGRPANTCVTNCRGGGLIAMTVSGCPRPAATSEAPYFSSIPNSSARNFVSVTASVSGGPPFPSVVTGIDAGGGLNQSRSVCPIIETVMPSCFGFFRHVRGPLKCRPNADGWEIGTSFWLVMAYSGFRLPTSRHQPCFPSFQEPKYLRPTET